MATVQFRGTREDVVLIAEDVAGMLTGAIPDRSGVAKGFLLALGFAALSDIKQAYIKKSRGGTDEMGIKCPPLSAKYLAYGRRFGRGEQSRLKKTAGLGRAHRTAPGDKKGLLTRSQLKQWRFLFVQYLLRFRLSEGEQRAKAHAAAVAWNIMKRRGARTKLEVFGHRQVEILRDTGVLFNSLSPGLLSGKADQVSYSKPTKKGGTEQIFDVRPGEVIVGTNVEYASKHQKGGKGLLGFPARPFLPDENHPVPQVWWERWEKVANKALVASVAMLYRRAS